jgi:hypothetical protein
MKTKSKNLKSKTKQHTYYNLIVILPFHAVMPGDNSDNQPEYFNKTSLTAVRREEPDLH